MRLLVPGTDIRYLCLLGSGVPTAYTLEYVITSPDDDDIPGVPCPCPP